MWDMQNIRKLIKDRKLRVAPSVIPSNSDQGEAEIYPETNSIEQANIVTSSVPMFGRGDWHMPVLDIDFPATLVPSSTPDHYHLYLHRYTTWSEYKKFLKACRDFGIIEEGFYQASIKRGYTSARLPWIKKDQVF